MRRIFYLLKRLYQLSVFKIKGGVAYAKLIGVEVGENCRIYTNSFGTEPNLIKIGNRVTITSGVIFLTHDGSTWLFRDKKGRRYLYNIIEIDNDVFIGVNSIIMPGVKISDKVVVGAGSVVTKSIPSGVIVAGNPAKIIGKYSDFENKALTSYLSDLDRKTLIIKEEVRGGRKKYLSE